MKMNSNLKKWSVLTLVAAATTLGLLSCHDKDEEKVEVPVVEAVTHSIGGVVLTPAEEAVSGAKVTATLGDKTLEASTDAQGKFVFEDLEKAGTRLGFHCRRTNRCEYGSRDCR